MCLGFVLKQLRVWINLRGYEGQEIGAIPARWSQKRNDKNTNHGKGGSTVGEELQ
jgi:hypothetical protein